MWHNSASAIHTHTFTASEKTLNTGHKLGEICYLVTGAMDG